MTGIRALAPARRPVLLRRFTQQECQPGQTLTVPFDVANMKDAKGRFGYVTGLVIHFVPQFTTVSATMTDTVPGRQVYGLLDNIRLRALDREVFRGDVDGRQLRDDMGFRWGRLVAQDPIDIPDADNTGEILGDCRLIHYFTPPQFVGHDLDGAIPLSCLQSDINGMDSLQFKLASALPGAPAGVTFDQMTEIRVYAIVQYEESPKVTYLPSLRQYMTLQLQQIVESSFPTRNTRCDYAVIRPHHNDANGQNVADYDTLTVEAGGDVIISAEEDDGVLTDLAVVGLSGHYPVGVTGIEANAVPPDFFGGFLPLYLPAVGSNAGDLGKLPVQWRVNARTTANETRVLLRERVPYTDGEIAEMLRRFGVNPAGKTVKYPGDFRGSSLPGRVTTGKVFAR